MSHDCGEIGQSLSLQLIHQLTSFTMLRNSASRAARRTFTTSPARMSHGPDGPYSNLPWKVHNRKYVPYWVLHFGFFALGLGIPFAITYNYLKKAGNI